MRNYASSEKKKHISNDFLIICLFHTSSILFYLFLHILPDISCDYGVIYLTGYLMVWISAWFRLCFCFHPRRLDHI